MYKLQEHLLQEVPETMEDTLNLHDNWVQQEQCKEARSHCNLQLGQYHASKYGH